MSLGLIFTIILLAIKLTDHGDPSWFWVFFPLGLEIILDVLVFVLAGSLIAAAAKSRPRR